MSLSAMMRENPRAHGHESHECMDHFRHTLNMVHPTQQFLALAIYARSAISPGGRLLLMVLVVGMEAGRDLAHHSPKTALYSITASAMASSRS